MNTPPLERLSEVESGISAAPTTLSDSEHRVLVVDDMPDLLELFVEILDIGGYEVQAASSGFQAIEQWRAAPGEFDLILSDYLMPDMNGGELISHLHDEGSTVPVILISGHQDLQVDHTAADLRGKGLVDWIDKPIRASALLEKVAQALPA